MKGYWEKRQEQGYLAAEEKANDYFRGLEKAFRHARNRIEMAIHDFYARYAEINGVSYRRAQELLSKAEIGRLKDYISEVYAHMGKYDRDVENRSVKARITRYQALEVQIDAILQNLYAVDYERDGESTLKDIYGEAYYRGWYNIDCYKGFHSEFAQISPQLLEQCISYPFNGANFSSRLWKQKDYMQGKLMEAVTVMMIQGRHPQTLAKEFAKQFQARQFDAYRLLHTESSFMVSCAMHDMYQQDEVPRYQILATLDSKTCGICGNLDREVFDTDKAVTGVNMPPFHDLCRCTDIPYYDDEDLSGEIRVARDPETGKSYDVPADMTYKEWHAKYIEQNPEKALAERKLRNEKADRKQYEKYQGLLGEEYAPGSFKDFQGIKYGTGDEYGILKAQAKGMGYYNKALLEEPEITAHVNSVAEQAHMDVVGIEHRVKGKDSYLNKIRRKYSPDGNVYEVKDILRYTYTAPADEMVEKTLKSIELHGNNGYNTVGVKNYWLDDLNPYNGINTTLRTSTGQAFELQYHTPESFELKNGKMHELYERQRLISDKDSKEYMAITDEMFELSDTLDTPDGVGRINDAR